MPRNNRAKRALQFGIGAAVSVALIYFAFKDVDFRAAWAHIRTIHVVPMLGAVVIATLAFPLRVPRWRLLLRADDGTPLRWGSLWNAIAIGFAANNVIPFRTGEVLRAAAIGRFANVSFASAASSIAVERVLDALTVITLLGIGLVGGGLPTAGGLQQTAEKIGILCLLALAAAIVAAWRRELALRLFERMLPSGPMAVKIVAFVDNLLRGLGAMREPRRAIPVVLWSVVIWTFSASAFYLAFKAFDFPLPFTGALVLQGALMIGIAAPSLPSGAGAFEAAAVLGLAIYGIDNNAAIAYGVAYHVATFFPITFLGGLAAYRTGIKLKPPADAPCPPG